MLKNQTCKVCKQRDKFDFHVPDKLWKEVVPSKFRNRVVCLSCFDNFAYKKGIDITDAINSPLYFAGDQVIYEFRIVSSVKPQF